MRQKKENVILNKNSFNKRKIAKIQIKNNHITRKGKLKLKQI